MFVVQLFGSVTAEPVSDNTAVVAALLATLSVPVRLPTAVGLNVTVIAQLAAGASVVPLQLFAVSGNALALVPPMVAVPNTRDPVPVFIAYTCTAYTDPTRSCPKGTVVTTPVPNVNDSAGTPPVPLSETTCGDPGALSATVSVAVKLPATAGTNVTEIEHEAEAANDVPHVLPDTEKSAAFVPPSVTPEIVRLPLPVFVSVVTCGTFELANVIDVTDSVAPGAVTVEIEPPPPQPETTPTIAANQNTATEPRPEILFEEITLENYQNPNPRDRAS
jgi:hypothetical protein